MEALSIGMTCKLAYHWFRTRKEFWEPFLKWLMEKRWEQFFIKEFANLMRVNYIMWPAVILKSGGVIGVVQSKLLFEFPCGDETIQRRELVVCRLYPTSISRAYFCLSFYNGTCYDERLPFGEFNYTGNGLISRRGKVGNNSFAYIEYLFMFSRSVMTVREFSQKI
jgi:hypothetical protein